MTSDLEHKVEPQRKIGVWREFDRAQKDLLARRYWENFTFNFALQLIGIWALAATLFLDLKLMSGSMSDGLPPVRFLVILFLALFPVTLIAGWLVDFQLSLRTPRDRERPAWIRSLRFLAACVVPFGPFVVPQLWKEVLVRNPPWSAPRSRQPFHLQIRSESEDLPARPFLERLYDSTFLQFLSLSGTLWGLVGIGVLLRSESKAADRMTLAVSVLAHVIVFFCSGAMLESVKAQGSRWSLAASLSRFLLLLPTPLSFLAFSPMLWSLTPSRLLVDSAYSDLSQARRLRLWRGLEQDLRREPERLSWTSFLKLRENNESRGESGRVSAERAALLRLKSLFLIPEAGLLSWIAARHLGLIGTDDKTLVPFLVGAFAFALAGSLLQAIPPIAQGLRFTRVSEILAPYLIGGYLFLPAAAFLIGWAGGLFVAGNRFQDLIQFLNLTVSMGTLLVLIYGIFRLRDHRFDFGVLVVWGFLLPLLLAILVRLVMKIENAPLGPFITVVAPCFGFLAGISLGSSLLHPFSWSALIESRISRGARIVLTILALTAILPLGGLAIPFWIWARQRLWPKYQRELFAEAR
jgi:hypothetical protein